MHTKSLMSLALAAALVGCGGGDELNSPGNTRGSIAVSGSPSMGETLTVSAEDADGIDESTLTYLWSIDIDGAVGSTGNSYTVMPEDVGGEVTVTVTYSDNAGFRENHSEAVGAVPDLFPVVATVIKGLVDGATCDLHEITEEGAQGDVVATATSANGVVDFGDNEYPIEGGYGLIVCSGGTYTDESTGETLDAPQLRAVVNVRSPDPDPDSEEVPAPAAYTVTPLTEIAVQLAGDNLNDTAAQAEAIAEAFGLGDVDITEQSVTDLNETASGAEGAEDADAYGTVLALLSQLDADAADGDIAAVIADLVADLGDDAEFSDATFDDLETAAANLGTSEVAANIDSDQLDLIGALIGYNNTPVVATFEGLSVTIEHDVEEAQTGTVTVIDPNTDEAFIVAQTDIEAIYGTFTITADGVWTYTVDTDNTTVSELVINESVNDTIVIESVDGTTADLVIRIAALTQVAEINNTSTGDTGELRLNLENHLLQGKLTVSFLKEVNQGSDGNTKDAYITLYGSSGSSSESLLDLRIQGEEVDGETVRAPRFFVRGTDNVENAAENRNTYPGDIVTADFTEDQWYDVEITWDMSQTNQVTISIDDRGGDDPIVLGAFSTGAVADTDFTDLDQWFAEGVQRIQFRFGDGGTTLVFGSYFVDDIVVYSDVEGTMVEFEDDFEGNDVGAVLNSDPYSTDSADAGVALFDFEQGDSGPVAAFFSGLTASIKSDETTLLEGTVTVVDENEGEDLIVAQAPADTTYGNFTIMPSGAWGYTLDTANATVAALMVGQSETDVIPIESADGSTADIEITILGQIAASGALNHVAVIRDLDGDEDEFGPDGTEDDDTNDGPDEGDTGELRYSFEDEIALDDTVTTGYLSGRFEVQVTRTDDSVGDDTTGIDAAVLANKNYKLGSGDAFINLFNSDTDDAGSLIKIRIKDDVFQLDYHKDCSGCDDVDLVDGSDVAVPPSIDAPVLSQYNTIVMTWEYTDLVATDSPVINVTIDGEAVLTDYTVLNEAPGGLTHVAFRFGDNDSWFDPRAKLVVDNWAVYSDVAGTNLVASDDFQSYSDGDSLDTDNPASDYHSNTADAVAEETAEALVNKLAVIRDLDGDEDEFGPDGTEDDDTNDGPDEGDTGELRYSFEDEIASDDTVTTGYLSGRFEVQVTRTDDSVGDDTTGIDAAVLANKNYKLGSGDAFINLFNSDTDDAGSLIKIRIKDDVFQLDYHKDCSGCDDVDLVDGSDVAVPPSIDAPLLSQFNTIVMTWEYPLASDSPVINVTIDGEAVLTDYTVLNEAPGGLTHVAFRFGDNDSWFDPRAKLVVDNWAVYSDVAGTNLVASDDFQSYSDGDSLDTDNPASDYHSNTADAVVEAE